MAIAKRRFGYHEGKPALFIIPTVRHEKSAGFIIKLDDLWKYSEDHNPHFGEFWPAQTAKILTVLGYQVAQDRHSFVKQMVQLANVIMDGIDDLIKMVPRDESTVEGVEPIFDVEAPKPLNMEGMSIIHQG